MPGAVMRSAFSRRQKKDPKTKTTTDPMKNNEDFRATGGANNGTSKSLGFYQGLEMRKKKKKKKEKQLKKKKAESDLEFRRRKAQELASKVEERRMSLQLEPIEQRRGRIFQYFLASFCGYMSGRSAPTEPSENLSVDTPATPPGNSPKESRAKPKLMRRSSSFSPDDEPEDYVVTEIQRVARGNFERRSIRQARVSTAEEIEKLKAEYEVKLRQLKAQHEEDLRKVYATIREAYVQSQSGHRD